MKTPAMDNQLEQGNLKTNEKVDNMLPSVENTSVNKLGLVEEQETEKSKNSKSNIQS